jgi:hypothetical protein
VRLSKEDTKDALLRFREERIRQALTTSGAPFRVHTQYGHNHARFGNDDQVRTTGALPTTPHD